MESKKNYYRTALDFLRSERFISWRLFRTKNMDDFWHHFMLDHPHLNSALNEAIHKFDAVWLDQKTCSDDEKEILFRRIEKSINRFYLRRRIIISCTSGAAAVLAYLFFSLVPSGHFGFGMNETSSAEINTMQMLPTEEAYFLSESRITDPRDDPGAASSKEGVIVILEKNMRFL